MKLDGDHALVMLREANPIPDPGQYRRTRDSAAANHEIEKDMEMITLDEPPATQPRRLPSPVFSLSLMTVVLAVLSVAMVLPSLSGGDEPPFSDPIQAVEALAARSGLSWSEMSDLFIPMATVDFNGTTRAWDSPALADEWDFDVARGARATVEECRRDEDWGVCRVVVTDTLLEAAGLPGLVQEWSVKLSEDGRIAIFRSQAVHTADLEQIREWYVDFNRWICRHHPADGRRLWDPLDREKEFADPDCTRTDWPWRSSGSPTDDAAEVLRLHDLYLADKQG
jgi:hypothetical protein